MAKKQILIIVKNLLPKTKKISVNNKANTLKRKLHFYPHYFLKRNLQVLLAVFTRVFLSISCHSDKIEYLHAMLNFWTKVLYGHPLAAFSFRLILVSNLSSGPISKKSFLHP